VYKLCYRDSLGSDSVEQFDIKLSAIPQTAPGTIVAIHPTSISAEAITEVVFNGTVSVGDHYQFAKACTPNTATKLVPVLSETKGTHPTNMVTIPSAGFYKLCYQRAGGQDVIEQVGITLSVVPKTTDNRIAHIKPVAIQAGTPTDITLFGSVFTGDTFKFASECKNEVPDVMPGVGSNPVTKYSIDGHGTYKLCYRSSGGSDSVEQQGITLEVTPAPASTMPGVVRARAEDTSLFSRSSILCIVFIGALVGVCVAWALGYLTIPWWQKAEL
jgi:hypothetical protein